MAELVFSVVQSLTTYLRPSRVPGCSVCCMCTGETIISSVDTVMVPARWSSCRTQRIRVGGMLPLMTEELTVMSEAGLKGRREEEGRRAGENSKLKRPVLELSL